MATESNADSQPAAPREEQLVVDVREHPPGSCMGLATTTFDGLAVGAQFELIADHDFRGLHYLFKAERAGQFDWEPLESGPELWRAKVSRTSSPQ